MKIAARCVCLALFLAAAPAFAQDVQVTVEKLSDHLYKLNTAGPGGNAACLASTGPDGILLVDTGAEAAAPKLKEAIDRLGGKLAAIILTHEHADHTGGLALLGRGVPIYAHPKVRGQLTSGFNVLRELPEGVLPNKPVDGITTLRFNGEEVRIIPVPGGHSDTDLVVLLTGSKIAFLGGFGNPTKFPYVDRAEGGSVAAYPELAARLLKELPADTLLVPGHGANSDMAALKAFQAMLVKSEKLFREALASGKEVKTLNAKELFKELESYGQGFVTQDLWLKTLAAEGKPGKSDSGKKSLIEPLHQALKEGGVDAVVARYRKLKSTAVDVYDFNENVLNLLGYHLLLSKNRPADAVVVLKLNVEEYPKAFNPCDSLGEAYLANGQRELAIKSYQKALELNPDFDNSKVQLKKLKEAEAREKEAAGKK
jgi:glyoxylase-like metal-dependent hydrolase (beta-lactamase superfamily II)